MKKIVKKLFYASFLFFLVPNLVLAQKGWDINKLGTDSTLPKGTIKGIFTNLMLWMLGIVGLVAIIGFCIAGILYLTSAGDDEKQKKAKSAMTYSIIGVVVALSGYVIWNSVQTMLKGNSSIF